MIAKSEWFVRRKYGGWGLFPKTWQGVVYSLIIAAITIGIIYIPLEIGYKIVLCGIWALLLMFDIGSAMIKIKDEREKIHEAISERNALWAIVIVAAIGISYQVAYSTVKQDYNQIDWFLIGAILTGLIVKAISNIYLDRKD